MYVNCLVKCIKYWLKIVALPNESLLKSCYNLLYSNCLIGKTNWASMIKDMLFRYGFGFLWEEQNVPDVSAFLKLLVQRIKDCELQQWSNDISNVAKLRTFILFKETRTEEAYLSLPIPRRLTVSLARFRTGSHNLGIETGRHENIAREDRLCQFCGQNKNIVVIEDEYHVLLECYVYEEMRDFYIKKYYGNVNQYTFICLMKNNDQSCIVDLANFISYIFRTRNSLM